MTFPIQAEWTDDAHSVVLRFTSAAITATAADIEGLIRWLATARARLQPPEPNAPPYGEPVTPLANPRYWVSYDGMSEGSLLGILHPGMGWIWSLFPQHERDRLVALLQNHQALGRAQKTAN